MLVSASRVCVLGIVWALRRRISVGLCAGSLVSSWFGNIQRIGCCEVQAVSYCMACTSSDATLSKEATSGALTPQRMSACCRHTEGDEV